MTTQQIAQVAHEINKAFCASIGDNSQPDWDDAPDWQKSSAVNGVIFHLENPDASPSASHDSWLKQKEDEGWKYGEVKDPEKKEHPCFVPYDQLPTEQKSKDYLFKQIVHSLKKYHTEENVSEAYEAGPGISTKHTSQCLRKAGDNEPIFVLRAVDPMAPQTIVSWVSASICNQPWEKLIRAVAVAKEMQDWRKDNVK